MLQLNKMIKLKKRLKILDKKYLLITAYYKLIIKNKSITLL